MDFEVKGAYRLLLDLIYMHGGRLVDEPRFIAGHLGCSVKKWNGLRAAIIATGKISVSDGYLGNLRADKELDSAKSFQTKQRENGSKPKQNKDIAQALAKPKANHTDTDTDTDKEEERGKPLSRPSADFQALLDHFNATADRVGWPKVQRITQARRAALSQRIADCGGEEAWRDAIDRAAMSPLLTGQTGRGWRADFDWLCKAANFTKLMEGNYDPRPETNSPVRIGTRGGGGMVEAFAAVAAARSGRAG
jgi:uncharacterized protein YdaU (DUF1376 family)